MSPLPPPEETAGKYLQQYEVYYKKLDPDGKNEIAAMDAAGFLKKSGLSDEQLGKIWDISDPDGKGHLDKAGLFVACKMVALIQSDMPLTVDNARVECHAPNFGDATAPGAPVAKVAAKKGGSVNFLVKPEEKRKYDTLFKQLQPQEGKLPGDKVRQVMIGSKLAMPILGQIWDLSDVDRDGFLDQYEFTIAMHLVYRALQGDKVPTELPEELSQDKVPKPLSDVPNLNGAPKPQVSQERERAPAIEAIPWVVNAGEKLRYMALFRQTDTDRDGFVSGIEIKNVFLQTGLPQNILAHIWNLCDINQEGKLNPEQFALAMWLIQRKQSGKDPPAALTPDMIPPTMRPKGQDAGKGGVFNNPELEMMAKEIQSLLSEKLQIEKEIQESEYNTSVKNTELGSLQGEFDTLASTLKQLTNQRDVAQKRLDDLDTQKTSLNADLVRLLTKVEEENLKIEKLRVQAEEQEANLTKQEDEVHGKQRELDALKEEEKQLMDDIKQSEKEIANFETKLTAATEINSEVEEQKTMLEEANVHMVEAMKQFKAYEENENADPSSVTDDFLQPLNLSFVEPDMSRLEKPSKPPVPEPPKMNGSMYNNSSNNSNENENDEKSGQNWSQHDAFAAFDESPFGGGAPTKPPESPQDEEEVPPPIAPRPDDDSPTPAIPPKGSAPPPRRPPPPKRPPPPGGAGGAPPSRPPPPGGEKSDDDDPFGSEAPKNENNGGGGFADFANFDSNFEFSKGWTSEVDSAFGSADPTPTHHAKPKSTLEFNEDPFQNANHRYGDPFDLEGADPFASTAEADDPFKASITAAFGATTSTLTSTSSLAVNNFSTTVSGSTPAAFSNDPFNAAWDTASVTSNTNTLDDSFDPFSAKSLQKQAKQNNVAAASSADPFGAAAPASSSTDPFFSAFGGTPSTATASSDKTTTKSNTMSDPFGANAAWDDPFSNPITKSKTSADAFADFRTNSIPKPPPNRSLQKSETTANVSQQNQFSSIPRNRPHHSKKSVGSSLVDALSPNTDKSKDKDKKEKKSKKFGFLPKSGGSSSSSKNNNSDLTIKNNLGLASASAPTAANLDEFALKKASEASRKVEEERLRRLRLQEEQDLAYAIALSKAEAASLKQQ